MKSLKLIIIFTFTIFFSNIANAQSYTCPAGHTLEGNQCVERIAPIVNDNRVYNWSCSGSAATNTNLAGNSVNCSTGTPPPSSAVCGSSTNNSTRSTAPATGLCDSGTSSGVSTGSTTYNWSCTNGSTVSCMAYRSATCGSSNGGSSSTAPTSGLCSIGSNSSVSEGSNFTWSCSNGSSTVNCSSNKSAVGGTWSSATGFQIGSVQYANNGVCNSSSQSAGFASSSVSGSCPTIGTTRDWYTCAGQAGATSIRYRQTCQ